VLRGERPPADLTAPAGREAMMRSRQWLRFPQPLLVVAMTALAVGSASASAWAGAGGLSPVKLREWQDHNDAGWKYFQRGEFSIAENRFRAAIDALKPYDPANARLMARSYCDLARTLNQQGRYAQAEPLAKWALKVREIHPRVAPEARFQSLYVLALTERALERLSESESLFRRALAMQEKDLQPDHPEIARTLHDLAGVLRDQKKYASAEADYLRALKIREGELPADHPEIAETLEQYAILLRRMGRISEASESEKRATDIRKSLALKAAQTSSARTRSRTGLKGFK
jgi:tetratricopeptide (TPR) repeat protein